MSKSFKTAVPDAWDDDWENLADRQDAFDAEYAATNKPKPTKAERRALHVEENRKIWKQAEEPPEPLIFLETHNNVPLKSEFRSSVKVLSRQARTAVPLRRPGLGDPKQETLQDDDDSGEEHVKDSPLTLSERQEKARREREEKQRKYQEVREKLFGPNQDKKHTGDTGRAKNSPGHSNPTSQNTSRPSSRQDAREHFSTHKRSQELWDKSRITKNVEKPIRMPKGPDNSCHGGAGFASRVGKNR